MEGVVNVWRATSIQQLEEVAALAPYNHCLLFFPLRLKACPRSQTAAKDDKASPRALLDCFIEQDTDWYSYLDTT